MKFNLIFQLFLSKSFLKKIILLWLNEVWNSTSNIILTISSQAHFQIIPYSLKIQDEQLISIQKWHLQFLFPQMSSSNSFIGLLKLFFDGKGLNDIDFRLKDFQVFWLIILTFLCWFVCLVWDLAKRIVYTIYLLPQSWYLVLNLFLIPRVDDFCGWGKGSLFEGC